MTFLYTATEVKTKFKLLNDNHATLVHAEIKSAYDSATGSEEERRIIARAFMRAQLIEDLGLEDYERVIKCFDFVPETGWVLVQLVTA